MGKPESLVVSSFIAVLALAQHWCTVKAAHVAYGAHEHAA